MLSLQPPPQERYTCVLDGATIKQVSGYLFRPVDQISDRPVLLIKAVDNGWKVPGDLL